ncbi:MAG: NAD(P)-dependent oxidoreductase [Clostridiales bacterium]|nr:NAD(P)-dependent oxidoreductase [Clostridiales bacterium]
MLTLYDEYKRLPLDGLEALRGSTILVTGATGLIGSCLVKALACAFDGDKDAPSVIALIRSREKAARVFSDVPVRNIVFAEGDVTRPVRIEGNVDHIVHAASVTASRAFVDAPADTIFTALNGTKNMLDLAREKGVKAFVYLSSMEVYGSPQSDEKISETHSTNLDTMLPRTSYPESKRMCESMVSAYKAQYGVPGMALRLTQTFGRGVAPDDRRVFAEFARCAIEGRDIILHTKGETRRSYLYTLDAASAILTLLAKGVPGEAYNAANESTYISIYDMALLAACVCGDGRTKVIIQDDDDGSRGYAPVLRMNLDTSKLRSLGWQPRTGLEDMFRVLTGEMRPGA